MLGGIEPQRIAVTKLRSSEKSQMQAKLPPFFSFKSATDLVRLGGNHDGGYLISKTDLKKTEVLIGLGISDDWSFEQQFFQFQDTEIFAYDGSISEKHFRKRFLRSLIAINHPKRVIQHLRTWLGFRHFFSHPQIHHIEQFVGFQSTNDQYCSMSQVLEQTNKSNIFFKIDIEGSEYRLLDTLIESQSRIIGLAMEFHDCDLHLKTIERFIKSFELKLVHVHVNNWAPIRLSDKLPTVIELTFSRHGELSDRMILPHPFDNPNDKRQSEVDVVISG